MKKQEPPNGLHCQCCGATPANDAEILIPTSYNSKSVEQFPADLTLEVIDRNIANQKTKLEHLCIQAANQLTDI